MRIIRSMTLAEISPIPVRTTKISESLMTLFQSWSPGAFWRSNFRLALHGANSASTANVTRMRIIPVQMPPYRAALQNKAPISFGYAQHKRSEEHTSELQSLTNLVCRLLLEKKKKKIE